MSLTPSPTLLDLLTQTRRRLGEGGFAEPIWSQSELLNYWGEGLAELSRVTEAIWDRDTLDDLPPASNYAFSFEPSFITSRAPVQYSGITNLDREVHTIGQRAEYDFPWERDYASSTFGPGEMDFTWERLYAPASSQHCAALVPLPELHLNTERVTWNDRRIDALRLAELERKDRVYDEATGDVIAYTGDSEGLDRLRKYHIPTVSPIPHALGVRGFPRGMVDPFDPSVVTMHLDEWGMVFAGILDAPPSIFGDFNPEVGAVTDNSWVMLGNFDIEGSGSLRLLPGYHPTPTPYGIVKRLSPSVRNTAIEFRRYTVPVLALTDRPELPPYQLTYARHYVCWRALKRRGRGQNLRLAAHYQQRWELGLARIERRMQLIHSQREIVLGGAGLSPTQPPLARPPWELDYGQLDKF